MAEFYSAIFRWGDRFCFTHPAEAPEPRGEHYAEVRREFGDRFVDVVYRQDALQALRDARDFTEAEQPF